MVGCYLIRVLQYLPYIQHYRTTPPNEVTYVNFQDKNPAKGLHNFDSGSILPKMMGEPFIKNEAALCLRYSFGDHYNFNKEMLSKSLGKLHPKIDSLQDRNDHGVNRYKMEKVHKDVTQTVTYFVIRLFSR
jgi:hypothetical protein